MVVVGVSVNTDLFFHSSNKFVGSWWLFYAVVRFLIFPLSFHHQVEFAGKDEAEKDCDGELTVTEEDDVQEIRICGMLEEKH